MVTQPAILLWSQNVEEQGAGDQFQGSERFVSKKMGGKGSPHLSSGTACQVPPLAKQSQDYGQCSAST